MNRKLMALCVLTLVGCNSSAQRNWSTYGDGVGVHAKFPFQPTVMGVPTPIPVGPGVLARSVSVGFSRSSPKDTPSPVSLSNASERTRTDIATMAVFVHEYPADKGAADIGRAESGVVPQNAPPATKVKDPSGVDWQEWTYTGGQPGGTPVVFHQRACVQGKKGYLIQLSGTFEPDELQYFYDNVVIDK